MLLLCNYPAGLFSWPEGQDSFPSFISTWNFLPFYRTLCQLIKDLALLWATKWLWCFWPILWMWNLPNDCCGLETLTPLLCSPNMTFRNEEETCISHLSSVLFFFFFSPTCYLIRIRSVMLVYLQVNKSYCHSLMLLSSFSTSRSVTMHFDSPRPLKCENCIKLLFSFSFGDLRSKVSSFFWGGLDSIVFGPYQSHIFVYVKSPLFR